MVTPLKAIVWRLPSGASGQAAQHYAYRLNRVVGKWFKDRGLEKEYFGSKLVKWTNRNWYRGVKAYWYVLTLPEHYATMLMLSWDDIRPVYIDDHIEPDEH